MSVEHDPPRGPGELCLRPESAEISHGMPTFWPNGNEDVGVSGIFLPTGLVNLSEREGGCTTHARVIVL